MVFLEQKDTLSKNDSRILWIDFLKTIGIWLVVLGHMSVPENIRNIIYSFHMPLFFFISGYLYKNKNVKNTVKHGIKTLLAPYFLLYAIDYLWWLPVNLMRHPEVYGTVTFENAVIKPFLGMIFGVGYDTDYSIMIDVPLWFLMGLFFVQVFYSIIEKILKNNYWAYLSVTCVMMGIAYIIKYIHTDLYLSIDSAFLAFPFFSIGNIFAKKIDFKSTDLVGVNRKIPIIATGIFCVIMLITAVPENGRIDINGAIFGKNIVLHYMIGFLGIASGIVLSLWYTKELKIITIISNGTILILAFHGIPTGIIYRIIGLRGEGILINPILGCTVALIIVLLFVLPIIIVKKYLPIIIGGRK